MKRFLLKTRTLCIILVLVMSYLVVYYAVNKIEIAIPTSLNVTDDFYIVLDAGHGGMDGGCSSADGVLEKDVNLSILLKVRDLCRLYGYNVDVTRDTDKSIHDKGVVGIRKQKMSDMDNRLAIFNKHSNALCVSIHQNKFTDPKYSGAQMFYADTHDDNEHIANLMKNRFVQNLQPDNTREIKRCGSELFLCHYCNNPTLMIECGFLSNIDEAKKLSSNEYQKQIAFTIFSGINDYIHEE